MSIEIYSDAHLEYCNSQDKIFFISTTVPQVAQRENWVAVEFVKQLLLLSCYKLTRQLVLLTAATGTQKAAPRQTSEVRLPPLVLKQHEAQPLQKYLIALYTEILLDLLMNCARKPRGRTEQSQAPPCSSQSSTAKMWLEQLWIMKTALAAHAIWHCLTGSGL